MKFMLSCKETSQLLSSEELLGWHRRLERRLHLAMCDQCSKYAAQLRILKTAAQKMVAKESTAHEAEITKIEREVVHKHAKH